MIIRKETSLGRASRICSSGAAPAIRRIRRGNGEIHDQDECATFHTGGRAARDHARNHHGLAGPVSSRGLKSSLLEEREFVDRRSSCDMMFA